MDLQVTRKGGREAFPKLQDGAYKCYEGDQIYIAVTESDIANLEVEGCLVKEKTVVRQDNLLTTQWQYCPATFAGRTRLVVTCSEQREVIDIDIAPDENKLGQEAFEDLLDELEARIPGLPWGLSPGHFHGLLQKRSAMIVRPRIVEDLLDDFVHALKGLRTDPLLHSKRVREVRRMSYTRRIDITTVRRLAQAPQAAVAWAGMIHSGETTAPPINIDQAVTVITHDHPVTRYLVWFLIRLKKDLLCLEDYLRQANIDKVGGIGEEGRAFCLTLAEKLAPVMELLVESLNRPPLAGISPAPLGDSATQALLDHPATLRIHNIARKMMSAGLSPDRDNGVLAGLRETCDLYEFLVLFRLADSLAVHLGTDWKWNAVRNPELTLLSDVPSTGLISLSDGTRHIELRTQQTFKKTSTADMSVGFMSLSEKRIPDFVIGVTDNEGTLLSWMVLDAKFRTKPSAVRDSFKQIHIYRDALRWNGLRPVGGYAVIPKLFEGTNLYASEAYRRDHNFGVLHCPLEPDDDWLAPVTAWLDNELINLAVVEG